MQAQNIALPVDYLLYNRYNIKATIGQGGFGITYLAQDEQLDVSVCIKELFIGGSSTRSTNMTVQSQSLGENFSFADFIDRFLEEARQLARFNHPNIVRVTDVFKANNTAYMVMEYVESETLKAKIERNGALPEKAALTVFGQLLDAVEVVHQMGMLHRDIKPDNILVSNDNKVVLIDFGSAREFAEGKTTTQTAMLTPGYAPIEQYSNRAQRGTYTDIYALGATLYYVLTGEKPIPATDRNLETLVPPDSLNKQVTTQLSSAVMMAMAMKPEDRFQGIEDIKEAILFLDNQSTVIVPPKDPSNTTISPIKKHKGNKHRRRSWWLVPIMVCVVIVGVALINIMPVEKAEITVVGNDTNEAKLYNSVTIGHQVWMAKNLDVDRFRNGDPIPQARTAEEWEQAGANKQPAWCYCDNDPANGAKYGRLYNWYAVQDYRGLAPAGWHVPSHAEWTFLANYLGTDAGSKMKSASGWKRNGNGTNSSGFSGLPGGTRNDDGSFTSSGNHSFFWSSTESRTGRAWICGLGGGDIDFVNIASNDNEYGLSVRCLKD